VDWFQRRQRNTENALKIVIVWLRRRQMMKFARHCYTLPTNGEDSSGKLN